MVVEGEYGIFPPAVLRPLRAVRRWIGREAESRQPEPADVAERAGLVHLVLSDDAFGSEAELAALWRLEAELMAAVSASAAGRYEGIVIGEGEAVLRTCGPDADRLLDAVGPVLRRRPPQWRGFVVKRYGPVGDPATSEVRVPLDRTR